MNVIAAPVPGGCNMENALEDDPNLHLTQTHAGRINRVLFQFANQGWPLVSALTYFVQKYIKLYVDEYYNETWARK